MEVPSIKALFRRRTHPLAVGAGGNARFLLENAGKVIIAGKAEDKKETIYEIADLTYHVRVLMVEAGITVEDIRKELESRHVIDHKVKQEKMVSDNQ